MSSLITLILVTIVIVNVQCAVIRIQEIPVRDDMVMKVVVKEGDGKSKRIASIKIDLEEKEPEFEEPPPHHLPKRKHGKINEPSSEEEITPPPTHYRSSKPKGPPVNNLPPRKPLGESEGTNAPTPSDEFIPDFSNRHGIDSNKCSTGKVRRGPLCV